MSEIDQVNLTTNGTRRRSNGITDSSTELSVKSETIAKEKSSASEDGSLGVESTVPMASETDARLQALVKERTALREEVAQVRKTLHEIQEKHEEELGTMREQLADTQGEKEQAETQYRNLLGKVNTIRSQLGERLKADAVGVRLAQPLCCSWVV